MNRRRVIALVVVAASPRLRAWVLEQLAGHAIDRLASRPWLPRTTFGPVWLGRYAAALAPTADTTDTMGANQ